MTLLEVLVSLLLFALLMSALVGFSTSGLNTWSEGEARKDVYDRAQRLFDMIAADLRNTHVENTWCPDGKNELLPPGFFGDRDPDRRARLRFVRSGTPEGGTSTGAGGGGGFPEDDFSALWETAYFFDADETKDSLYRATRRFNRQKGGSLLEDATLQRPTAAQMRGFPRIDDGVLHLEFLYWTQFTNTWDDSQRTIREIPRDGRKSGPSSVWDSTRRRVSSFVFHRRNTNLQDADFVYPAAVRIELTLEARTPGETVRTLAREVTASDTRLPLSSAQGLPGMSGFLKVGSEWVEYRSIQSGEVEVKKRGARGTKPAAHPAGERVRFGQTFVTEVTIPAHREAAKP